jgi:hypothetical protein
MLRGIRSRLTYANVMATAAMFIALGGGAYALSGIPDSSGVFHGCVSKKTGALRVVASATSCQRAARRHGRVLDPGEFAVTWNQQGPPGQPGQTGRNGTNGLNGTNGVNGVNGVDGADGVNGATNLNIKTEVFDAGTAESTIPCNTGERAVSGGMSRTNGFASTEDAVTQSAPAVVEGGKAHIALPGESANAWAVGFNNTGVAASFTVYAVCASP